jgi:MFS family permease
MLTRTLTAILPKTAAGRKLAAGAAVDSVGSGMFLAGATLYFVTVVGLPATQVGIVLSAASALGLVTTVPLGRLADRFDPTVVYVALLMIRGAGYAGYAFIESLWPYAVLTCVLTALDRGCAPLQQVMVGLIEGVQNQTRTMASIRSLRNVGLTLGFLLAGMVLALQSRPAFAALFIANSLTFFVIAAVVARLRRSAVIEAPATGSEGAAAFSSEIRSDEPVRSPARDLRFMLFTVSNGLLSLHDSVLFILLPLWLATVSSAPASVVSVLLAVNTVLTVLMQVYVTRFAENTAGAQRLIWVAVVALLLACAAFAGAAHVSMWLAVAFALLAVVLLTVGENVHSVAAWKLSYDMSPPPARARYLAAFSLGTIGQDIAGPLLMTAVILPLEGAGWALLAVLFAMAALVLRATGGPRPAPGTGDRTPAPTEAAL